VETVVALNYIVVVKDYVKDVIILDFVNVTQVQVEKNYVKDVIHFDVVVDQNDHGKVLRKYINTFLQ